MNIKGVGTDIVNIERIQRLWERYGMQFAEKILSMDEISVLNAVTNKERYLAKRFAAKEAVVKALGTGFWIEGIVLSDVVISNDKLGKPLVELRGKAKVRLEALGAQEVYLSIADEHEMVVGFAIVSS